MKIQKIPTEKWLPPQKMTMSCRIMVAGSDAYQIALMFYNSVKLLAAQDISGAKAVYEELKKFFHKSRAKSQD